MAAPHGKADACRSRQGLHRGRRHPTRLTPTLGHFEAITADDENHLALWAPASFARGFCALSELADIEYLTTGTYNGETESGIAWDDPDVGIDWPIEDPRLSSRDRAAQSLAQWLARPEAQHFRYAG